MGSQNTDSVYRGLTGQAGVMPSCNVAAKRTGCFGHPKSTAGGRRAGLLPGWVHGGALLQARRRLGDICAGTVVVPELNAWTKALAIVLRIAVLAGYGWAVLRICARNHGVHRLLYLNQVVAQFGRTDNSAYARVVRLKIAVQRKDDQFAPHAPTQDAPAFAPLAGRD